MEAQIRIRKNMHRLGRRFMSFFRRQVRPFLCADCTVKMDRKFGLAHKIRHKMRRRKGRKGKSRKSGRKLRAGIHRIKVGKRMRKVKVLANGRWRFMKG